MTTRALAVSEIIEAVELALHNLAEKGTNTCWRGHTVACGLDRAYCVLLPICPAGSLLDYWGLWGGFCRTYPSDECVPPVGERRESRCVLVPQRHLRRVDRNRKCRRVGQRDDIGGILTLKAKQA